MMTFDHATISTRMQAYGPQKYILSIVSKTYQYLSSMYISMQTNILGIFQITFDWTVEKVFGYKYE